MIRTRATRDCYTLLADDSSVFASDPDAYRAFKAHIVYNFVFNSGIVFSDNQMLSARNLRKLVRHDALTRELYRRGAFGLAIRDKPDGGIFTLAEVHDAFVRQGKLPRDDSYGDSPELAFAAEHARVLPWSWDTVTRRFHDTSQKLVLREFAEKLSDTALGRLRSLLADQRNTEEGLGRHFYRFTLPALMARDAISTGEDPLPTIIACTDAPYVSNLPAVIGLSPIYAAEHQRSFDLLRGGKPVLDDEAAPHRMTPKLDYPHFVEGLNQLDLDAIDRLTATPAAIAYRRLQSGPIGEGDFDELYLAFIELNLLIEDEIVSAFPKLRRDSRIDQERRVRKLRRVGGDYAMNAGSDVAGIALEHVGAAIPFLGTGIKILIDIVASHRGPAPAERRDAADRAIDQRALEKLLRATGKNARLTFETRRLPNDEFTKEVIVR